MPIIEACVQKSTNRTSQVHISQEKLVIRQEDPYSLKKMRLFHLK